MRPRRGSAFERAAGRVQVQVPVPNGTAGRSAGGVAPERSRGWTGHCAARTMVNMFTEHVHPRAAMRERSRARVLDAAAALFAERGFAASTVRDIAMAAGVSVGTVMSVGDKDRLLLEVMERRIDGLQRSALPDAGPLSERVLALLTPFVELFGADIDLARAFAGVLVSGRHRSTVVGELAEDLQERIATLAYSMGATDEASARAFAEVVHHAYFGVLFVAAAAGPDVDVHDVVERLERTLSTICLSFEES